MQVQILTVFENLSLKSKIFFTIDMLDQNSLKIWHQKKFLHTLALCCTLLSTCNIYYHNSWVCIWMWNITLIDAIHLYLNNRTEQSSSNRLLNSHHLTHVTQNTPSTRHKSKCTYTIHKIHPVLDTNLNVRIRYTKYTQY